MNSAADAVVMSKGTTCVGGGTAERIPPPTRIHRPFVLPFKRSSTIRQVLYRIVTQ